jgi:hypothetical protein
MRMNIFTAIVVAIFFLCVLCAPSAHAQLAPVLQNNPAPIHMADHPQTASEHQIARESTLLSITPYGYAQGETPLAELGSIPYQMPLGDVARAYRREHELAPKAVVVWEK